MDISGPEWQASQQNLVTFKEDRQKEIKKYLQNKKINPDVKVSLPEIFGFLDTMVLTLHFFNYN